MKEVVSKAIRVPKNEGEYIRRLLVEQHVLRTDLRIKKTELELIFPIIEETSISQSFPLITEPFELQPHSIVSYKEMIQIPNEYKPFLPTSFDVVGDILLIKIPKGLNEYKRQIGKALLKTQKHVKTVCNIDPVSGELRTHSVEVIAGKENTQTIHTEYGIRLYVDVAETYFSPRLAGERHRIAKLVKDGEVIVDLFSGVAPFPLMIARYAHPKKIIAIDKNPAAISLAQRNVLRNKALDIIDVVEMDAQNGESVLHTRGMTADRIIMNLPLNSFRFLPVAFSLMSTQAVIHLYEIIHEDKINWRKESIVQRAQQEMVTIKDMKAHKIKTYAPHEFYIGIDITAQKSC